MAEENVKSERKQPSSLKTKVDKNKVKEVLQKTTKQVINFTLIGLLIVASFFIGHYYSDIESVITNKKQNFGEVKNRNNTSISITERGELMIIDRLDQKIQIYDDTIASIIFNTYSNRLISSPKKLNK
jgi:hypothetical protein